LPPLNSDIIDTERRRTNHGAINSDAMKAYLITTGTLFGILAVAHVARTVAESRRLTTDAGFLLEGPGIGIVAAALSVWAWRLLRRSRS
jgi:ABC-type cobalamin transport system permease subunit